MVRFNEWEKFCRANSSVFIYTLQVYVALLFIEMSEDQRRWTKWELFSFFFLTKEHETITRVCVVDVSVNSLYSVLFMFDICKWVFRLCSLCSSVYLWKMDKKSLYNMEIFCVERRFLSVLWFLSWSLWDVLLFGSLEWFWRNILLDRFLTAQISI